MPRGSETHFKVVVVSGLFDGHKLLARHRMVNDALAEELKGCDANTPRMGDLLSATTAPPPGQQE